MAKVQPPLDVLTLGQHPSAYLAAIALRSKGALRVAHATIPDERTPDRLVLINPAFFDLHPLLEPLRRKLETVNVYGLQFLSEDPQVRSEHRAKSAVAMVASYKAITDALEKIAVAEGVTLFASKTLHLHQLDETGIDLTINSATLRAKALIVSGALPAGQERQLGLADPFSADVMHRYTWLRLTGAKWADLGSRPVIPMSLNLNQQLCWGWLLPGPKCLQLCVEQPVETINRLPAKELLRIWAEVLLAHGALNSRADLGLESAKHLDLPLAALVHEGLANRTLLIGPAGGFYSACCEDIYPNCWSALYAADAIRKAIKEPHLQDALHPFRSKWRTSLGAYLRGPQQNFRFLLPLVYRNQVMTARLAECILLGKSVVR